MIEFKNVTKSFDEKTKALDNVSFKIPNNSIYGIIGANGAGKSTLLRLASSIIKPDEGEILVDNKLSYDNEDVKKEIVFIPDELYFPHNYNLIDTANFYKSLYDKFDIEFFKEEAKNLKLDLNKPITSFSKGTKRQSALLLALACNTKYILLDETFDGLDIVIKKHFRKLLIKQVANNFATIILTSHNIKDLEDICDNLSLIYNGSLVLSGNTDTLKTNMIKIQISFDSYFDEQLFKDFNIISFKKIGNVATIILEDKKNIKEKLKKMNPILLEFLTLSLEEIFIHKMEVLGYEFN